MKAMKEKLKEALRPIYDKLLKDNSINQLQQIIRKDTQEYVYEYACMAPFVGDKFSKAENNGIIYYGRATNGWQSSVKSDFDEIYDKGFINEKGENGYFEYIFENKSAFLRVAGKVFNEYYGDDWYNHVTYSNLCKVAPHSGNPNNSVYEAQNKYVTKIFKEEIKTLSPKFVVLFVGKSWAKDFLRYINDDKEPQPLETIEWDKDYEYSLSVYKIGEVYYLVSEHPQGKKENLHAEAILSVFEKYK